MENEKDCLLQQIEQWEHEYKELKNEKEDLLIDLATCRKTIKRMRKVNKMEVLELVDLVLNHELSELGVLDLRILIDSEKGLRISFYPKKNVETLHYQMDDTLIDEKLIESKISFMLEAIKHQYSISKPSDSETPKESN